MTKIISINKETLSQLNILNLKGRFTLNRASPGIGKTLYIKYLINEFHTKAKFTFTIMICMPSHKHIEEFISRSYKLLEQINYIWLKGKNQKGICAKRNIVSRYSPGCKICNFRKQCKYWKLRKEAETASVIFIVPQHLFLVTKYKPYVLIIDESIENIVHTAIQVPEWIVLDFNPIECEECPLKNDCKPRYKRLKGITKGKYKCIFRVPKKDYNLDIETLNEYFFDYNMKNTEEIYGVWDNKRKRHVLIGYNSLDFLKDVSTIIYNDATGKVSMVEKHIGRKLDLILEDDEPLLNPTLILLEQMSLNKTEKELENLISYMNLFKIPLTDDTVIFTKMKFFYSLEALLPEEVNIEYYGRLGRGTNRYEHCHNVVLWGRFDLPYHVKELLKLHDVDYEDSNWIGMSEEIQAMHRIRPLLDRNKRIFLFTNSISGQFKENENLIGFMRSHLKICTEILDNKQKYEGLTITQISKKIKKDIRYVRYSLDILWYFGWTDEMKKRGAKLKCLELTVKN